MTSYFRIGCSRRQKVVDADSSLAEYGTERTFGHVACVMGNGHLASRGSMTPDLVASGTVAVEYESEGMKTADNFTVFETGKASHGRPSADTYGHQKVQWAFTELGQCRRKRVAVFKAGLHDLARQPLSDLDSFHEAATLSDQAGNVRTGGHVPALVEGLEVQPDRCFVQLHPVALTSRIGVAFGAHFGSPTSEV